MSDVRGPKPTDDVTAAAAKLGHHVMRLMLDREDEERSDLAFNYIHVLGFADAFEEAKRLGIDARGFVDWMLHESEGARLLENARAIVAAGHEEAEARKKK